MTFSTWSQTAASNTSVGGISTDGTVTLVKQIDNMIRGMMAELAVARDDGTIKATAARGYLYGLTLSNNAGDAVNDIDIAVGECATLDSPYWKMALASVLTKRLDANWAVGTNQGGLDTGAIANTTYHIWLIARSDTGVVDALFSTSATSPTMPANYDRKRRIGSIRRVAAAIVLFHQFEDTFSLDTFVTDRNSTSAAASALLAVSVPSGINVRPIFSGNLVIAAGAEVAVELGSPPFVSATNETVNRAISGTSAHGTAVSFPPNFYTNTSAQVYFATVIIAGTININNLVTHGWIDSRGKI